ncbi:hypothetical protein VTO42DRAFT_4987 [Malbranchea cinnamomea]
MDESPSPLLTEFALLLSIRFSASIPDVHLDVPSPSTTTGAGLKQLIRAELPASLARRRLRLICAGRALEDSVPLARQLKVKWRRPAVVVRDDWYNEPPTTASTTTTTTITVPGSAGNRNGVSDEETYLDPSDKKGKKPVRNNDPQVYAAAPLSGKESEVRGSGSRIYVHCSIGDIVLSKEDLAAEAEMARLDPADQQQRAGDESSQFPTTTTEEAPRGFDRLLSAGFTPAEVSALRSQFLALQSLTHTPDTMPTGEALRRLEDQWMDEGSTRDGMQDVGGFGGGLTDDGGSGLDDMLWGSVMGFFWPVGCALWLLREEGVWSWRKGLAVFVGVVINFAFGMVLALN